MLGRSAPPQVDGARRLRVAAALAAGALVPLAAAATAPAAVVIQRGADNAIAVLGDDPTNPTVVGTGRCPVLTPDGGTVLFHSVADDALFAVPVTGGKPRLLAPGAVATSSCSRQAVVSADGSTVAAQTKNRKIMLVKLADGALTRLRATTVSQLAVVPGGGSVVIDRNAKGGGIDLYSVRNRAKLDRRRLTSDRVSFSPTWAGGRIVYSRIQGGRSTLRSLNTKNRRSKLLVRRPKGWLVSAIGIGPNGGTVLATTQKFRERKSGLQTTGPVRIGAVSSRGKVTWRLLSPDEQLLSGVDGGAAALTVTPSGELIRVGLADGSRTVLTTGIVSAYGS
jgi:hypothetical protein